MHKEHYSFHTPPVNEIAWRYVNFSKFIDLLISEQMFFCRSDKFEDPYEGVIRTRDYEQNKEMVSAHESLTKQYYFLNCWHLNENQSDAMWKIFLDTKNGIAIKSSVGKIINSLKTTEEDIYVSKVYYRDIEKLTFYELITEKQNSVFNGNGTSFNQFNYKRKSFEHEKELRLYYIDMPIPHVIKNGIPREPLEYKKININLNELVDEIVIAPFADDWFVELVNNIVKRLNFNFNITKSNLYTLSS